MAVTKSGLSASAPIAGIRAFGHHGNMSDVPKPDRTALLDWVTPTIGACCFGVLMFAGMSLGRGHRLILAMCFILIGLAAGMAAKRLTQPYTPPAFGFYVFAGGSLFFGVIAMAAQI